jgi:hypothetical protein
MLLFGLALASGVAERAASNIARRLLLATLMGSLVFALHGLPHAAAGPFSVVGPFLLAAAAFVLLLTVEARAEAPLVDLSFFARRGFAMGVAIASLSMFSTMSLLLYFNLYAQSREGLTRPNGAGDRGIAAAAERVTARACPVGFRRGGTRRAAQCHDRRDGADFRLPVRS